MQVQGAHGDDGGGGLEVGPLGSESASVSKYTSQSVLFFHRLAGSVEPMHPESISAPATEVRDCASRLPICRELRLQVWGIT